MNEKTRFFVLKSFLHILLLLVFAGCDQITPTNTRVPVQRTGWLGSWLFKPACPLPCWENITPGKSRSEDAINSLKQIPEVKIRDDISVKGKDIIFEIGRNDGGTLFFNDGIVSRVALNISMDTDLEFQEFLSVFGDPNEVLIYDCFGVFGDNNCDVRLYYKNKGIIIHLLVPDIGKGEYGVEIRPDSMVKTITLVPSDVPEDMDQSRSRLNPKYLFQWKGFTSYP